MLRGWGEGCCLGTLGETSGWPQAQGEVAHVSSAEHWQLQLSTCNLPQCSRPQEGTESWLWAQVSQESNTCTHTCGGRQQKGMPREGLACSKERGERSRWHPDGRTRKTQKEEMVGGLQQPVSVLSLRRGEDLRPLCEAIRKKAGGGVIGRIMPPTKHSCLNPWNG